MLSCCVLSFVLLYFNLLKRLNILAQDKTSSFVLQFIGYYPVRLWDTTQQVIGAKTVFMVYIRAKTVFMVFTLTP